MTDTQTHECGFRVFGECDGLSCGNFPCTGRMYSPPEQIPLYKPASAQGWRAATAILLFMAATVIGLSIMAGAETWPNTRIAEASQ